MAIGPCLLHDLGSQDSFEVKFSDLYSDLTNDSVNLPVPNHYRGYRAEPQDCQARPLSATLLRYGVQARTVEQQVAVSHHSCRLHWSVDSQHAAFDDNWFKLVLLGDEEHDGGEEHDDIDDDECNNSEMVQLEAALQAASIPL